MNETINNNTTLYFAPPMLLFEFNETKGNPTQGNTRGKEGAKEIPFKSFTSFFPCMGGWFGIQIRENLVRI